MTRFRVVVAGLGFVSDWWLPELMRTRDVEIVAVVEPDDDRARAATTRHGLTCPRYVHLADALDEAAAGLVVDLTPPRSHRETVALALDRGCHVLGEKPMAATFEDALELVARAERSGLKYTVMQNRRYEPAIRRLRRGIEAGAIGDPIFACADMFMAPRHAKTYLEVQESPLLKEMAIHTFDQARYLLAADPVAVFCYEFNPPGSWYQGDAAAVCTFELPSGGVFSYRASWVSSGFETSYDAVWRISGTRGTAVWDSFGDPACEVPLPGDHVRSQAPVKRTRWQVRRRGTGHTDAVRAMLAALRKGERAETDCTDNIRSLAMSFAAVRSAAEGRRVRLDELLGDGG